MKSQRSLDSQRFIMFYCRESPGHETMLAIPVQQVKHNIEITEFHPPLFY